MTSPLEGKIAATIGKAFASTFYDATLVRVTPGTVDPDEPWVPVADTITNYACKGMIDTYSAYHLANSLVEADDRRILILASSLSVTPTENDTVTIRGSSYSIIDVKTDPAIAVYELQCRS